MLFNSLDFLIFFPVVLLIYYLIPNKLKNIWLLLSSYYFYMCWNAKYIILILISTIITYISGILLESVKKEKTDEKKSKIKKYLIVLCSFALNLGILFYFKYINFAANILCFLFRKINIELNIPAMDIILPVGISFYTFQALGYTVDVYRDEISAEKNFLKYALFVSFFPQLVAGPIERCGNLLGQLSHPKSFDYEKARDGLLLITWGYFLKIVLADRIAIFVDCVYGNHSEYAGYYIIIATMLFAVQIYCDFAGYSVIAMGTAKMLGIELMENFNVPYLATSVADFWRRWHISLTSWFRDYLYFPLGGSRKGVFRKYFNKMIVFLVSGLWHGASLSFVIWGGLNGSYQIVGEIMEPVRKKVLNFLGLNIHSFGHRLLRIIVTFILVDFSWIFFRASSLRESFEIIDHMFSVSNPWIVFDGSLYNCGLDVKNFWVMILAIGLLLFADICKKRNIIIRNVIQEQDCWFRILFISCSILAILVFGKWGPTFEQANFIYFQF